MPNTNETYNKMKRELSDLKAEMSWLDNSFLLDTEVDAKKIYGYLKSNPSAAPFIYEKYKDLRQILIEISNPRNPPYLPKVREELNGIIDLESKKDDIKAVEEKLTALRNEKLKIEEEIHEKANQYDELDQRIMDAEKKAEEIDRQMGNLTDPEVLAMVKNFYNEFISFSQSVLDVKEPEKISQVLLQTRSLNRDQVHTLKLLLEKATANLNTIANEDMLSELKLSEIKQKLKEQIQQERDNAQREMEGFAGYNPKKVLDKVANSLDLIEKKLTGADGDGSGGRWLNKIGFGMLIGELNETMALLSHLQDQVENKRNRMKRRRIQGQISY